MKAVHDKYFFWIKKYEILFISEKYILMHFSRKRKFNMKALIQLKNIEKKSEKLIHVLEIWFDSWLNWNSHLNRIMQKMKNQINALFKITKFIWSFLLIQTQQVYLTMIRSAFIYKIIVWYQSHQQLFSLLKSIKVEITIKLKKQQNMCFW